MDSALAFLQMALAFLRSAPIIIQMVSGFLVFFSTAFILLFFFPALWKLFKLTVIVRRLKALAKSGSQDPGIIFVGDRTLRHLWSEYRHTLHEQRSLDHETGTVTSSVMRSTIPAGMIFTTETVVDTPLGTEFFKHLPGLFTGVGIIGTFFGLIHGLQNFHVSEEAAEVRISLEGLMHAVSAAFIVSGSAIAAAMLTTLVEKLLVTALYRKVEQITILIDGMFDSGAGEEYLARLVKASEDGLDQTKILKDALVTDFERILTNLAERQIQAQVQGSQDLARQFSESLSAGLQGPLERIAESVQHTSQGNTEAVTRLLTDVLSGFGQRLEELFGGQITGINQLQQQTIQALQSAVTKLDQMATGIEAAGTRTSDAMGQKLSDAITAMESRQSMMNERMAEFVEQLRGVVRESQTETNQKLQETLSEIGNAVRHQLAAIKEQGEQAASIHAVREQQTADKTQASSERLGALMELMVRTVGAMTTEVGGTVEAMRSVTTDMAARMNSGAETMLMAAAEFSKAGQGITGVLSQSTSVTDKLAAAANSVTAGATAMEGVVRDYAATRETLANMLADLRTTVEAAKREASLTSDILARIEGSSEKLGQAQRDADEYLDLVSRVLTEAHSTFTEKLTAALSGGYNEFYERLSRSTTLLREAIDELAAAVEPPLGRRG